MQTLSDHRPVQVVVNKSLADEFAAIVMKRLHESEHKVQLAKIRLHEAQKMLDLAMDEHLVNSANFHALTNRPPIVDAVQSRGAETGNYRIEPAPPENRGVYRQRIKFWRESGFPGWREYTKSVLDNSREFLSLSDFLDGSGESDPDERRRLESSISNALTTLHQRGEAGALQILGERGRFYGSALIFEKGRPQGDSVKNLQRRLSVNLDEFVIQEVYPPQGR